MRCSYFFLKRRLKKYIPTAITTKNKKHKLYLALQTRFYMLQIKKVQQILSKRIRSI
nr:hypothetical protein [uncultured bacterium]